MINPHRLHGFSKQYKSRFPGLIWSYQVDLIFMERMLRERNFAIAQIAPCDRQLQELLQQGRRGATDSVFMGSEVAREQEDKELRFLGLKTKPYITRLSVLNLEKILVLMSWRLKLVQL